MNPSRYPPARLALLALLAGCGGTPSPAADGALGARVARYEVDSARTLAHELASGFGTPARLVVPNRTSWAETWALAYAHVTPHPAVPFVDFDTERVLVAAQGVRSTGGFDIRIDSVVGYERGTVAYVTSTSPGAGCATTQALTSPAHLVRVPKPAGPFVFRDRDVVRDCP